MMGFRSGNRSLPNPLHYSGQTIYSTYVYSILSLLLKLLFTVAFYHVITILLRYVRYVKPKNEKMTIRDKIQSNRLRASSINSSTPVKAVTVYNKTQKENSKAQKENNKAVYTQITDLKRNSSTTSKGNLDKRRSRSHTDINTLTPALAGGSSSLRFATTENHHGIGNGVGVGPVSNANALKEVSNSVRSSTPSLIQANEKDENRGKRAINNISGIFARRSSDRNSFSLKDRYPDNEIIKIIADVLFCL